MKPISSFIKAKKTLKIWWNKFDFFNPWTIDCVITNETTINPAKRIVTIYWKKVLDIVELTQYWYLAYWLVYVNDKRELDTAVCFFNADKSVFEEAESFAKEVKDKIKWLISHEVDKFKK